MEEVDPFLYLNDSPSDFVKNEEPKKLSLEQTSSPEPEPEPTINFSPESSPEPMETEPPSIPVKNEEPKRMALEQENSPEPVETEPEPPIENSLVLSSPEQPPPEPMDMDILQEAENDSDMKQQLHNAVAGKLSVLYIYTFVHFINLTVIAPTHRKCEACNKLLTKRGYSAHIRTIRHKRNTNALTKVPDISDPDFFCNICEKKFEKRIAYLQHLRRVHKMEATALVSNIPKECNICKEVFPSHAQYLSHYVQEHHGTTQKENNPDTEIQEEPVTTTTEHNKDNAQEMTVELRKGKNGEKRVRNYAIAQEKKKLRSAAAPFEKPDCMMCKVKCNMKTLYLGLFKDSVEGDMEKLREFVSRVNPSLQLDDKNNKCDWCLAL